MVNLINQPVIRLSDGTFIPADAYEGPLEEAREHSMAWSILKSHNQADDMEQMLLKFDSLLSPDDNYTSIMLELAATGDKPFPIPWVLTNCHNTLAAAGGTINNDDHRYGLGCMKKMGGIYVPQYLSVVHQYIREAVVATGDLILGSDSHTRYGCFGAMGIGEGGTELARHALGSFYELRRPPILALHLTGKLNPGVGPMDAALTLIGATFGNGFAKNKILEVVGDGIEGLSVDFRMGFDAMTTESAAFSSVWMTDEKVAGWFACHGRPDAYAPLAPAGDALYDGLIELDLGRVEPMIALPFHPSNVYKIRELSENQDYLMDVLAQIEKDALKRSGLTYTLRDKVKNGRLHVQQASIAGCVGGTFENIAAAADILDGFFVGADNIDLGIYPASQPILLELMRQEIAPRLIRSGVAIRPCICGPCFGVLDVPANNTLAIRHVTRNYYCREGSKVAEGQLSAVALMDARSIAATVRNAGRLTAATELDTSYGTYGYHFDETIYKHVVYNGYEAPRTDIEPEKGTNIKDWPIFPIMKKHVLLKVAGRYNGSTTTDELCPSGEVSSMRSNPERISSYTLISKDCSYVEAARAIRRPYEQQDADTRAVIDQVCAQLDVARDELTYGSMLISDLIGDGSSREQAASNQKVLSGWANLTTEYSNKRYRSNCISWGLIPLRLDELPDLAKGEYLLLPNVRQQILKGAVELEGVLFSTGETVTFQIGHMTVEERDMLTAGGMINFYRNHG
jgi:aconitate hydratase